MSGSHQAIFLDRDGVINHDPGDYTRNLDEFTVLPTVFETLKQLHDVGYLLVLITNQGGVAKSLYSHADVNKIHSHFMAQCRQHGFALTGIFYSPHHPDFGESLSRKPGSLMLERACAKFDIDPSKSWMIGDKLRDIEAGEGAGVKGLLLPVNGDISDLLETLLSSPQQAGQPHE
jgi:D-glycero-D-manno-heptose 1,7-bisphosphate phosphatase